MIDVCKPESRGLLTNGQLRFLKAFLDQFNGGPEGSYTICRQESEK